MPGARLNRNILECKYVNISIHMFVVCVLIETYWNVNEYYPGEFEYRYDVLIETYWNVNVCVIHMTYVPPIVLIETYWNVND